jgi:hypothetical protein
MQPNESKDRLKIAAWDIDPLTLAAYNALATQLPRKHRIE